MLTCLGCGSEIDAEGKACSSCETEVVARCGSCAQPVLPGFAHCPACGERLGADERRVALASSFRRLREQMPAGLAEKVLATRGRIEGERKQVTVLFCDLVSSATIAERMDPEEFRDLLDRYLAVVFDEVARFEGLVNQIAGDGVMALFGAPLAHEDAPVRAVRAAIAVRSGLARLSESLRSEGRPALTARIGLNTGPVIVGTVGGDLKLDYTAIGDTTNLAARLQTLARPGAILMSESVHRMVSGHVHSRALGAQAIRGKSLPVEVFELEGAIDARHPRSLASSRAEPFVGRRGELASLEAAFERACRGRGQAVGIVGQAGFGASRLVAELVRRLHERPCRVLWAQCFSYTQRAAYRPFVDLLRDEVVGDREDGAEWLERLVAEGEPVDGDATGVTTALRRLLGLDAGRTSLEGEELRNATVDAVTACLIAISGPRPLVLVLEDVQWIDDASRELLGVLVDRSRDAPVLVLCTYRPDAPPPWTGGDDIVEIELGSLDREETAQVASLVAGGKIAPEVVDAIHDRAEGNPFFIEEVTRDLLETGLLSESPDGTWTARGSAEVEVPATVHEIVAARLDRLAAEDKRVLQVASVMGRHFSGELVRDLLAPEGIDVAVRLDRLRESGVVQGSVSGTAHDFVFGQALTQEVAYQGLLLKERRRLHEQIGEALLQRHGAEIGEHSAIIAYHFGNGERRDRALPFLLDAASHAESVPSYGTAAHLYRRAWDIARGDVTTEAGARQALLAGLRLLWLGAIFGEGTGSVLESLGEEVEGLLARVGTSEDRIAASTFRGLLQVCGAAEQHVSGLGRLARAEELARREGRTEWSWRVRRGLSLGYALDGRFEEALRNAEEILSEVSETEHARRTSDVFLWARATRDTVLMYCDRFEEAVRESRSTYELATEAGNRTVRIALAGQVATIFLLRNELDEALSWAHDGLALAAAVASRSGVPNLAAIAALAGRRRGDVAEESRLLRQIESHLNGAAGVQQSLRFATEAFLAADDVDRAERVAQSVRRRAGGRLRQAQSACDLGAVALRRGRDSWKRAEYFFDEAVRVARDIGAATTLAVALEGRAALASACGEEERAQEAGAEALRVAERVGHRWWSRLEGVVRA